MRKKNDAYYTVDMVAAKCVDSIVPYLPFANTIEDDRIFSRPLVGLEPSFGGLSFVRAVEQELSFKRQYYVSMDGVDLHPPNTPLVTGPTSKFDFTYTISNFKNYKFRRPYDFAVGNPPYSEADEHIYHLFHQVDQQDPSLDFVAGFLLRCGFRHTLKRKYLMDKYPPYALHGLRRRPSFTGDGKTDGTEYDFIIWRRSNGLWLSNPGIVWID